MPKLQGDFLIGWKNVPGSSKVSPSCACGSWKQHWLNYSGCSEWPSKCSVVGCDEEATDGGHVEKEGLERIIVPLCSKHNSSDNEQAMSFKEGTYWARANQAETCGKKK